MKLPRAQGRPNEFMTVPFSAKAHHCNKVNIFQPSDSSVLRCFVIYLVYHPRKGAKTKSNDPDPMCRKYHPRKGAITIKQMRQNSEIPYHPRKGAKTKSNDPDPMCRKYHPRKGAITIKQMRQNSEIPYHPRKGAKPKLRKFRVFAMPYNPRKGAITTLRTLSCCTNSVQSP